MAALPKRRHSTHRKGKRRTAIKLKSAPLYPCPECGQAKPSHQACPHCGFYKGKQVISLRKKKDEKGKRSQTSAKKKGR